MNIHSKFNEALPYLPAALRQPLTRLSAEQAAEVQEIRLRAGRSLQIVRQGRAFAVGGQGQLTAPNGAGVPVTRAALDALFQNICSHSLHAWQDAIRQGFITIAGGSRVGLCGTAVMQQGALETVRTVSGLNLRIASERIGCAEALCAQLAARLTAGGILIAGAPASGKTTILRDLARILGDAHRISLLDTRGELAAVQNGLPQFALGAQTDIFDGYPKAEGLEIAVRVMSPEILICDEIGGADEAEALLQSLHTGVQIIASAHAGSLAELTARPQIRRLIDAGAFRTGVLLGSGAQCGQVLAVESLRRAAG